MKERFAIALGDFLLSTTAVTKSVLATALILFLLVGVVAGTSGIVQNPPLDGAHNHPRYETALAQIEGTNAAQSTRDSVILTSIAGTRVLPSPSPFTATWTRTPTPTRTPTNTPCCTGPTPTVDEASPTPDSPTSLTVTALTNLPPTWTNTPDPDRTATPTALPENQEDYMCQITTNDVLSRRETPSPNGNKINNIAANTVLWIHPNDSSIPYQTVTDGYWYVRIADISGGGYALYARTINPSLATPNAEPIITNGPFMDPYANSECEVIIRRR